MLLFLSPDEADKVLRQGMPQAAGSQASETWERDDTRKSTFPSSGSRPSSDSRLAKFRPKDRTMSDARNQLPDAIIFSAPVHSCYWMVSDTATHVSDFRKYFHFLMEQYHGPVIFVDIQEIANHRFAEEWLKCVRAINGEALRLSKQYGVAYIRRSELTKASLETCDDSGKSRLTGHNHKNFASNNITETDVKAQKCAMGSLSKVDSLDVGVHFMRGVMQGILLQYLDKALRCVL